MEPQSSLEQAPQQSNVPATWPGGFGLFKHAKAAYMINLGPNLIIIVLTLLISGILPKVLGENAGQLVAQIIAFVLSVASTMLYLAGSKGQKLSLGSAFPKNFMLYLKFIGLSIIVGVSLALSLILLIVPFFFVAPRLSLATYFLIDKNMGVMEAYKASWAATKGNVGKVYGIVGVIIVFAVLCLILVGIYFSLMYSTAFALLYLYLQQNPGAAPEPVAQSAPAFNTPPAPQVQPPAVPQAPNLPPQNQAPQPPVTPPTPPLVQ